MPKLIFQHLGAQLSVSHPPSHFDPVNGTGWDRRGCHLCTVICRTDPSAPADQALAVILVPGNTPGVSVVDVYDKVGHRGVVTPRVHFDRVRVPAGDLDMAASVTLRQVVRCNRLRRQRESSPPAALEGPPGGAVRHDDTRTAPSNGVSLTL
jgi:hypothetical protein